MKRQDLLHKLNDIFGEDELEKHSNEWGLKGLDLTRDIKRVGWATTLLPATINKATELEIDFLITHHDAWAWLFEIRSTCLEIIEKNSIGHLFVHGLLDQADFGTNGTMLKSIGCGSTELFCKEDGLSWGRIGELETPVSIDTVENKLMNDFSEQSRYKHIGKTNCRRIASVTGAGCNTGYIKEAIEAGCDTFITGEYNCYFRMYVEMMDLNALVFSHTYTEKKATRILSERLFSSNDKIELIELPEEHY